LATALVERGVGAQAAEETVRKYPAEEIRTQVEALDWLVARKDSRVSRNPPGFLLSAIQGGYATPPGFIGSAEQERREQERRARLEITAKQQIRREERERRHEEMQQQAVDQFLERLPSDERLQLENEAVRSALTLQRSLIQKGGRLAVAARKLAIENYVLRVLGKIA
jgi:cell shape-determining protein MreC